jgi:DNA-binding transcriptional regulator LsrR (DeoR family)
MADDVQRRARLAQIGELYYVAQLRQSEIAERFNISAMQVSRLLREAHELGIVEFKINHPVPHDLALAGELRSKYGLEGVVAVDTSRPEHEKADVARAGAHYLPSLLRSDSTLAIPWSSTLALLAQALPHQPIAGLRAVQMLGALTLSADRFNPYDAFKQIGTQLGAQMHPLHAPTLLASKGARDALVGDPAIKDVLDMARRADCAIYGIGTADYDSTFYRLGYLSREELDSLQRKGAVGDILGSFIDVDGRPLPWTYSEHRVALELSELRQIPRVVAVAAGRAKVRSILGALNGRYLTHLVTDAGTARALLEVGEEIAST